MKHLISLSATLLLSGCFGGTAIDAPATLEDFDAAAKVRELWSADTGKGPGVNYLRLQPALARDAIYTTDVRGRVRALKRDSGDEIWSNKLDLPVTSGVGLGDDLVLVGTRKGDVVALDRATGKELWRAQVPTEVLSPPAAEAGVAVVQSVDGKLTAFASGTGKRLWTVDRSEPALSLRGTAAPTIFSSIVVSGFASGKILAASLRDGRVLWEIPVAQPQGRSEIERLIDVDIPVLRAGPVLLAAAYQGKIVALGLENGRLLWSSEISTNSALATDGVNVYVSDTRGIVHALNLKTGATAWKQEKLHGRSPGAPVVVGDAVAVGDYQGYLHWLERNSGKFLARERLARSAILSSPLSDDDVLYALAQNGDLAALRLEPRKP